MGGLFPPGHLAHYCDLSTLGTALKVDILLRATPTGVFVKRMLTKHFDIPFMGGWGGTYSLTFGFFPIFLFSISSFFFFLLKDSRITKFLQLLDS